MQACPFLLSKCRKSEEFKQADEIQQALLADCLKPCDCEGISPSSAQESSSALELCQPRIKCLQLAWILPRSFDCGRFLRICILSIAPESPENDSISFQRVVPVDGTARPNDVCASCRASQRVEVLGPSIEDLDAREPSDRYLCGKAIGPKRGKVSMHVVGWTVGVVGPSLGKKGASANARRLGWRLRCRSGWPMRCFGRG